MLPGLDPVVSRVIVETGSERALKSADEDRPDSIGAKQNQILASRAGCARKA